MNESRGREEHDQGPCARAINGLIDKCSAKQGEIERSRHSRPLRVNPIMHHLLSLGIDPNRNSAARRCAWPRSPFFSGGGPGGGAPPGGGFFFFFFFPPNVKVIRDRASTQCRRPGPTCCPCKSLAMSRRWASGNADRKVRTARTR